MQEEQFPSWDFEIGDPSFMGWFTIFVYFFTMCLCYLVRKNSGKLFPDSTVQKQRSFWSILTVIMFALGINKQLDLQTYMTTIGKYYARRDGWYQHRAIFQYSFIKFIFVLSFSSLALLIFYLRDTFIDNILAILGICLLLGFIAIRASSFHHVDAFISSSIFSVRMNWIMELSAIFLISLSAGLILKRLIKR